MKLKIKKPAANISYTPYGLNLKLVFRPNSKLSKFDIPCPQSVRCIATPLGFMQKNLPKSCPIGLLFVTLLND